MITLCKMTEDEFHAFKKSIVADYAVVFMKGRNINPEKALMEVEWKMIREAKANGSTRITEINVTSRRFSWWYSASFSRLYRQ